MALKVVGAGLGRTGTHSLKIALERLLGAPCYHMVEVFQHMDHVPIWHAAARGETVDWETLLAGYEAAVDWPSAAFWPELSAKYPDALVVLSTRPVDAWWGSAHDTIFPSIERMHDTEEHQRWYDMVHAMLDARFTSDTENREACVAKFLEHDKHVRNTVPADRLLVWQATDGWEPLCKALNVPVPDEPFPVTNTKKEFLDRVNNRS